MSRAQAAAVEDLLREGPLDLGGNLAEQRSLLESLMASSPLPRAVTTSTGNLGAVATVEVTPSSAAVSGVVLYFHGGAYALGSAQAGAGVLAEIASRTRRIGISVENRLAPEHPFPAALDDALAAYRGLIERGANPADIVIAGESSGGGLALSLLQALQQRGDEQPAAAVVFSPWADLTVSGQSVIDRADVDPALTAQALQVRAVDYAADTPLDTPALSPLFGNFKGLPPLLIQVGSHEILLDDSLRVAVGAATADVAVTLEVTPRVPHVFQGFASTLEEGAAALDSAASFITRHLTRSES
ncbi:MAG: alpha/beta hydrolase fold domain-containing protein [Microbacteriaceae bacterium]